MDKPVLNKQAFWDVDMEKIDYEKNAAHVIEKVIDRGSFDDFHELRRFYGDETIRREVVNANWLGDKEIHFCCVVFNLEPINFKCFLKKQLNPKLWVY